MVYLVIGIVLAMAVGAIIKQRSRQSAEQPENMEIEQQQSTPAAGASAVTAEAAAAANAMLAEAVATETADSVSFSPGGKREKPKPQPAPPAPAQSAPDGPGFSMEEEVIPLKPVVAAEPLSSPNALNSATYASLANQTASKESPYAYGNTADEAKPKPENTLLRWSGKTGALQIGDMTIRGPVAYWSDGPSATPEPSCIDIKLPVEFPTGENEIPAEGAVSYGEMTPLQRGVYLQWLAGGRIQPPPHACYPIVWLFGLERRVLADRLDMGICIGEAFRLLPLLRWDSLRQSLIKFITWLAAKMWMPEEELLAFSRSLTAVPKEILNMLLWPYADARLPLPSIIAFTIMRASPLAEENGLEQPLFPHSDELMAQFGPKYKSKCEGGIVLSKPKTSVFVAYVPTNPTLMGDKKTSGGVLELPDFFKDASVFEPLVSAWRDFLKSAFPQGTQPPQPNASEELEARPDWESFITNLAQGSQKTQGTAEAESGDVFAGPVTAALGAVGELLGIARPREGKKFEAADRKKISEAARVEGFLVLPDLGIAGKEYLWDEPVCLAPFPSGERVSQEYSAAALMLEYMCALGRPVADALPEMTAGLGEYFSLSSGDAARLEALSSVLNPSLSTSESGAQAMAARANPENIGESLQFWLQKEPRGLVGAFLARFLQEFLPAGQNWPAAVGKSLDIEPPDIPPLPAVEEEGAEGTEAIKVTKNPQRELGSKVVQALTPLFKD